MKKLLLVAALCGFGCTAGVKAPQTGKGGTSAAGVAGNGGPGTGGNVITGAAGTTGPGGTGSGSGGNTGTGGGCASDSVGAELVPLDLYFLMDSSKSMLDPTGAGSSKWMAVNAAFGTFFGDAGSAGLAVALKYFPDVQAGPPATCTVDGECMVGGTSYGACDRRKTCVGMTSSTTAVSPLCLNASTCGSQGCELIKICGTNSYCAEGPSVAPMNACAAACTTFSGYCHLRDICTGTKYATPDVPMMALPAGASALSASLSGRTPDGYTPTGPALTGAVAYAKQRLVSTPDHRVAIVLVTDGLPGGFLPGFPPTECAPSDVATIASTIVMPAATAKPGIPTFVVGIFNPATNEGMMAPGNLMTLAQAGGTGNPVIIDVTQGDVTQKLRDALKQVQSKAIACTYKIPPPRSGSLGIDFGKVNVNFTTGAGASEIIPKTSKAACDARGGWYYDVEKSDTTTPSEIHACDATCQRLQQDVDGHVVIQLGCMTITID